jgi:hypothetical protein
MRRPTEVDGRQKDGDGRMKRENGKRGGEEQTNKRRTEELMSHVARRTVYHHTLILTFRPFLVMRATMRQEDSEGAGQPHPPPPPWLDAACEYCLDAARHSIAFLIRAFEKNEMCRVSTPCEL